MLLLHVVLLLLIVPRDCSLPVSHLSCSTSPASLPLLLELICATTTATVTVVPRRPCSVLLAEYADGETCPYSGIAARVQRKDVAAVSAQDRQIYKTVVLGILYGQGCVCAACLRMSIARVS